MSDLNDRLAQADPFAGTTYVHRDLETLIARVTSAPINAPRKWWRGFQVKIAGSLIVSALVTTTAIVALDGAGSNLPLLAITGTGFHAAASVAPRADLDFATASVASQRLRFSAATNLTASSGSTADALVTPSLRLSTPEASREVVRVARVFGVAGAPQRENADGSDWLVGDAQGATLEYLNSGVPQWTYSNGAANTTSTTGNGLPSRATLESDATRIIAKLGYGYRVGSPEFSTSETSSPTAVAIEWNAESVSYTVYVDGLATDQSVYFTVNTKDQLVSASGPAFDVAAKTNYPLERPSAGVPRLNAAQSTSRRPGTTKGITDQSVVVPVKLTSTSLTLASFTLSDGSLWLLPVYDYRGYATTASGATSHGQWSELAVEPKYVSGSGAVLFGGRDDVNY